LRGETARRNGRFSRGLHLRRKGCASRDASPVTEECTHVRTHARTYARIRDVMNVKLNDALPSSREPEDCVCFIQEVLITIPLSFSFSLSPSLSLSFSLAVSTSIVSEYHSPRDISRHLKKSKRLPTKDVEETRLMCIINVLRKENKARRG